MTDEGGGDVPQEVFFFFGEADPSGSGRNIGLRVDLFRPSSDLTN